MASPDLPDPIVPSSSHADHLGPDEDEVIPVAEEAPLTEEGKTQKAAGLVSIAIMCSRLLGLVREVVLGGLFGGSRLMDAFMVAFRMPNMLRDLFAEGALSTAFITTFSQKLKKEGDGAAWDLARKMVTLTAVFMGLVTLLGVLLAPWIVRLFTLGWADEKPELIPLTTTLSQIIYSFILMLSLAALVMGMLNSKGVFFIPALSSSFFNLGSIVAGVLLGFWMEPEFFYPLFREDAVNPVPQPGYMPGQKALVGMAIGVVFGGFCQLAVQLPSLRKVGFRFRPDFQWKDSGVRRVLALMVPAVISGAAVQIGVAINTIFAAFLPMDGSVSYLQWAFRLIQLPIGVFGVAIATVTLPAASRAATEGITDEFRSILARGLRLVMVLTIPSALGLAILAEPIISVIWQRWRFTADDTLAVASALRFYSIGLVFYAAIKVLQPTFYSIDRRWVPMYISLASIAVNAILNAFWVFVFEKGHEFLALSTTVSAILNFFVLYLVMLAMTKRLHTGDLFGTTFRVILAAAGLSAVCLFSRFTVLSNWQTQGFAWNALWLFSTIFIAGLGYFLLGRLLRLQELDQFSSLLMRKLRRS